MRLILSILIVFISNCSNSIQRNEVLMSTYKLDIQGHRGARGLSPENTAPAFEKAMKLGVDTLELDLVMTSDNQLIVYHDTELNLELCKKMDRSNLISRPISEMKLSELKELDCGGLPNSRFPNQVLVPNTPPITLGEVFELVKKFESENPTSKKVKVNIESKFPKNPNAKMFNDFAALILEEIKKASFEDRTIVQSFHHQILPIIKSKNPKLTTAALFAPGKFEFIQLKLGWRNKIQDSILESTMKVNADIVSPYFSYVDESLMSKAKIYQLKVIPWTVNEIDDMKYLIQLGVDGIITDYPDRLIDTYSKMTGK
jgi:glycerophosphoryl diester phosphodiesterase